MYGDQLPSGEYQVDAGWQAGLMNGALAGSMVGLAANGILVGSFDILVFKHHG